jgi:hypothetical protein
MNSYKPELILAISKPPIKYLVGRVGCSIGIEDNTAHSGNPAPLLMASGTGHGEVVRLLCEARASMDQAMQSRIPYTLPAIHIPSARVEKMAIILCIPRTNNARHECGGGCEGCCYSEEMEHAGQQ